jgi:hypothetical protein
VIALIVGTLLAIGAMAFVLVPLFRPPGEQPLDAGATEREATRSDAAPDGTAGRREQAVEALREIEFDRATGKLADADYVALKARYTGEAVAAMRDATGGGVPAVAAGGVPPTDDELEALIRRTRAASPACPLHGPRAEEDARYCSECGAWLGGPCRRCGAPVTGSGARFCNDCGEKLAA